MMIRLIAMPGIIQCLENSIPSPQNAITEFAKNPIKSITSTTVSDFGIINFLYINFENRQPQINNIVAVTKLLNNIPRVINT